MTLPIDPEDCPWTDEYDEKRIARIERQRAIMLERAEERDLEEYFCRRAHS